MSTQGHTPERPASRPEGAPPHRYSAAFANDLERRWQGTWDRAGVYRQPNPGEPGFDARKPKFYCLDMFPYPSGAGLHVGHPEGYTATDIVSRFKRMRGFNVLHPMGWDAFGLPAEQYAIQTGVHPAITTKKSIETFKRQLQRFGFSYDWSREYGTIDPEYYRWTQWIFLKLYDAWVDPGAPTPRARPIAQLSAQLEAGERPARINPEAHEFSDADKAQDFGPWPRVSPQDRRRIIDSYRLAYIGETMVNWCPKLGTVLANDEVIDGRSERGGYPVLRKPLKQWMFRITSYAERLLSQLDHLDWPESTRAMQREWIGKSEGAEIEFEVPGVRRISEPTTTPSTSPRSQPPRPDANTVDSRFEAQSLFARYPTFTGCDPFPPHAPSPHDLVTQVRNLPHVQLPGATYFVTWSTNGWHLDGCGRDIAMRALMHFDGARCDVIAACVMSSHVHWIVRPHEGHPLRDLVASVKRFSATEVNKHESMSGPLWQEDAFDHIVRDERWLGAFVRYIAMHPVEARAVERPSEYRWTFVAPDCVHAGSGASLSLGGAWRVRGSVEGVVVGSESRRTSESSLRVFTTRPDTIFGATYMVVAPEHPLVDAVLASPGARTHLPTVRAYVDAARKRSDVERMESKDKTGVDLGIDAINPANGKPIPIWVADYVLMGYGTGAIMAVPSGDERDFEFAKKFGLEIVKVVEPAKAPHAERGGAPSECFSGEGVAINSAGPDVSLDGLSTPDAKRTIIAWLDRTRRGTRKVNFKLRDWTFSRQRYWGEPIPIVFDDAGNHYPLRDSALPVRLPELADYAPIESDDPQPLLAKAKDWARTTAGAAGVDPALLPPETHVSRECNTMPGSAGSSWYFLRYCDARNDSAFADREALDYWMGGGPSPRGTGVPPVPTPSTNPPASLGGVDLYLGGSEHAVGHLLYARFWNSVLFDLGCVPTPEPFKKLFHQGLITSFAYQRADKTLVPSDEVEEKSEGVHVERATGAPLTPIVAKMSKSLKNVVNPDDVIAEFGADTFRLYEMYMGPLEASKPWNPRDITGCFRFLQRAWRVCVDEHTGAPRFADTRDEKLERALHRLIKKVEGDVERLAFNTAIAAMIEFVNACVGDKPPLTRDQVERFALVLCPFVPHVAEEIWARAGRATPLVLEPWPTHDPAMLVESEVEVPVSIMGKVRSKVMAPTGADAKTLEALALADPRIVELLAGKAIKKVIVVPGKMVNIVHA